jgi:hypothetical protein
LTVEALTDFLPLDVTLDVKTVRHDTLKVAERCEAELEEEQWSFIEGCPRDWSNLPIPDGPITVGIDGGYVRDWEIKKHNLALQERTPENLREALLTARYSRKFSGISRSQALCLRAHLRQGAWYEPDEPPDCGPAHAQLPGDGGLTESGSRKPLHIRCPVGDGWRPSMPLAMSTGLRNTGFDPLTQNLPLKLRKDRQQAGHGPPRRRGEIQRFVERDEPHPQFVQLMQRAHKIDDRPSPPI